MSSPYDSKTQLEHYTYRTVLRGCERKPRCIDVQTHFTESTEENPAKKTKVVASYNLPDSEEVVYACIATGKQLPLDQAKAAIKRLIDSIVPAHDTPAARDAFLAFDKAARAALGDVKEFDAIKQHVFNTLWNAAGRKILATDKCASLR